MNNKRKEISDAIYYGGLEISRLDADGLSAKIMWLLSESEEEKPHRGSVSAICVNLDHRECRGCACFCHQKEETNYKLQYNIDESCPEVMLNGIAYVPKKDKPEGCTHIYEKGHCPHDGCPNYHVFVEKPALPEKMELRIPRPNDNLGTVTAHVSIDLKNKINEILDYLEAQRKQ